MTDISTILNSGGTVLAAYGAKKLYDDFASPSIKEAGLLGAKIFRAITISVDVWADKRIDKLTALQNDIVNNLKDFDKEDIVEIAPDYIVAPAINAYMHSMSSNELRSMYANLISKSLLKDQLPSIHPSMTFIIQNLAPIDCVLLNYLALNNHSIPLMETHWETDNQNGYIKSLNHLFLQPTAIDTDSNNDESIVIKKASQLQLGLPSTIDNLMRLGLLEVSYIEYFSNEELYKPIKVLPVYIEDEQKCLQAKRIFTPTPGIAKLTSLGKDFIDICID